MGTERELKSLARPLGQMLPSLSRDDGRGDLKNYIMLLGLAKFNALSNVPLSPLLSHKIKIIEEMK